MAPCVPRHSATFRIDLSSRSLKPLTTKDTKDHEGIPLCTFVSLVVQAFLPAALGFAQPLRHLDELLCPLHHRRIDHLRSQADHAQPALLCFLKRSYNLQRLFDLGL